MKVSIKQPQSIFKLLSDRADGILVHFTEDLHVHDFQALRQKIKSNTIWLWIVHKSGTHLARFDQDQYAGTKDSHLECLIRSGCRDSWPNYKAYLFTVESVDKLKGAMGSISAPVTFEYLATRLPRPKPRVLLPGESQEVYSASFALAGLK